MNKDYIVIRECMTPYDEYTEWKIVPKCIGPVDAVEKAKFRVPTSHSEDFTLTVIELGEDTTSIVFTPKAGPIVWTKN